MTFSECVLEEKRLHPASGPQDLVKLAYQAAFGGEHLLADREAARLRFETDFAASPASANRLLAQDISETLCRVDLGAWKERGYPANDLFELFLRSAAIPAAGQGAFVENVKTISALILAKTLEQDWKDWLTYLSAYSAQGQGPVHHSAIYAQKYLPNYRLVSIDLLEAYLASLAD
jgi:hypothetical protein